MKSDQEQIKKAAQDLAQKLSADQADNIKGAVKKVAQAAMIPKDMLKLSDQYVEGIYGQAYRLYNTGKYVEAGKLFQLLIMINALEPKFILGLAACFHMLRDYKNAVETYTICTLLDPESPLPHYHCSDCYINIGDPLSAMVCLDLAIKRAENKPQYQVLVDRSKLTLESLQQEVDRKYGKKKSK